MKIFYMGKEVKQQPRTTKGKYTRKSRAKGIAIVAFIFALSFLGFKALVTGNTVVAESVQVAAAQPVDTMPERVDALKNEVINSIAQCESQNAPQDMAIVRFDNNHKGTLARKDIPSYGVMQFKVSTVQLFYKQLQGTDITDYEAVMLALDNDRAKALAKDAIFNLKGSIWNWTCATPEMGAKVEIIREIEAK